MNSIKYYLLMSLEGTNWYRAVEIPKQSRKSNAWGIPGLNRLIPSHSSILNQGKFQSPKGSARHNWKKVEQIKNVYLMIGFEKKEWFVNSSHEPDIHLKNQKRYSILSWKMEVQIEIVNWV